MTEYFVALLQYYHNIIIVIIKLKGKGVVYFDGTKGLPFLRHSPYNVSALLTLNTVPKKLSRRINT